MAHYAVHVGDRPAGTAHEVMVVVAHARFEASWAAGGLDAADEARAGQYVEHVIDRLGGHGAQPSAGRHGDVVNDRVVPLAHRPHHSHSRCRDAETGVAQAGDVCFVLALSADHRRHTIRMLELVKKTTA
jgi:hypothetical protein